MADKQGPASFPEVLKLQEELRANFEARLEKLKPNRKLSADDLIAMRKADLDRTKAALAAVEKQRDSSAKAWADVGSAKDSAKEAAKATTKTAAAAPAKKK
jgi:hypothetical protein